MLKSLSLFKFEKKYFYCSERVQPGDIVKSASGQKAKIISISENEYVVNLL